jgi:hypothetical protein
MGHTTACCCEQSVPFGGRSRRQSTRPRLVARVARAFAGTAAVLAVAANTAFGQTQSQLQYVYDAAGNLIQVTRSAIVPQPDLTVSNLAAGLISGNVDGSYAIPVAFQVNNIGTSPALAPWYDRGYLSANATLHDSDQVLAGYNTRSANLGVGASYLVSTTLVTNAATPSGSYTLIVKADAGAGAGQYGPTGNNYVPEANETNNTQAVTIELPANPKPDLTVSNASVGAITISQGGAYSFPVTFTVTNGGTAAAAPTWFDATYLSNNSTLDNSDLNLGGFNMRTTALPVGASYATTTIFTTPTTTLPGNDILFVKADGHGTTFGNGTNTDSGNVKESDEANNTQSLALALPTKPDLVLSNVSVGTIIKNGDGSKSIPVTFKVTNAGGVFAPPTWFDLAYLSTNATLDDVDLNLGGFNMRTTRLGAGANYTATATFITPTTTTTGAYTLFLKTDGRGVTVSNGANTDNGYLTEGNETNNVIGVAVNLP